MTATATAQKKMGLLFLCIASGCVTAGPEDATLLISADGPFSSCAITADDRRVLIAQKQMAALYFREGGRAIQTFEGTISDIVRCEFCQNEKYVVAQTRSGGLYLWSTNDGVLKATLLQAYGAHAFSSVPGTSEILLTASNLDVLLWRPVAKDSRGLLHKLGSTASLASCCITPDGLYGITRASTPDVTGKERGVLTIWDLRKARLERVVPLASGRIVDLVAEPDGRAVIVSFEDGSLQKISLGDGTVAWSNQWAETRRNPLSRLSMRKDGKVLACRSVHDAFVIDLDSRRLLRTRHLRGKFVFDICMENGHLSALICAGTHRDGVCESIGYTARN